MLVWVEPWAERFELAPQTLLNVAFFGPRGGILEFSPPLPNGFVVHGWEGSEFIAIENSRVLGHLPHVEEIVRQEMELASEKVERTAAPLPVADIAAAQRLLDQDAEVNPNSQKDACEAAASTGLSLIECFVTSESSRALIWEIVRQIVRTRGLFLADLDQQQWQDIWNNGQLDVAKRINHRTIPAIPSGDGEDLAGNAAPLSETMPQPAASESRRVPH